MKILKKILFLLKKIFAVLKSAARAWVEKDPFRESATIAYYAIFSLPGLLLTVVSIAGYFFGTKSVNAHLASEFSSTLGSDTAQQIQGMIVKAGTSKNSILATVIGVITIFIGATGVFAQFQKSLNIIWEVKADNAKSGIGHLIRTRLFSFGLIISIAFILIASLLVSTSLTALGTWLSSHFSNAFALLLQVVNYLVCYIVLSVLFALMFKYLPDKKIKWNQVWFGSIITAQLFGIGRSALGLYFGKANPAGSYGAAGSVILILLWVSYTSMIVLFGAEFTREWTMFGSGKVKAGKNAMKAKSS